MATSLTKADVGLLRYGLPEGVSLHMYPDHDERKRSVKAVLQTHTFILYSVISKKIMIF